MKTKKTRARGKIVTEIGGVTYAFRMSSDGLTIRRKWARHEKTVTFHELIDYADGQLALALDNLQALIK